MARKGQAYLKRRESFREPKRKFILFCEGENTEKGYFLALRQHCDALIDVIVENPGSNPRTLANAAIEYRRRNSRAGDSFEEADEVWIVFDRDENPAEHIHDAVQRCQSNDIGVARSNPCFELWLILHEEDYDRPGGRHAVQAHYRTLRPEYDPGRDKTANWPEILPRVQDAERRARRQLKWREEVRDPFGEPSTTMFELTEAINTAARLARGADTTETATADPAIRRSTS